MDRTGWVASSSAPYHGDYSVSKVLDNKTGNPDGDAFASLPGSYNWIQLDMLEEKQVNTYDCKVIHSSSCYHNPCKYHQNIAKVEVIKRNAYASRFKTVELRIGNIDYAGSGYIHLDGNPLVGYFEGPDSNTTTNYILDPLAFGRYVSIQAIQSTQLDIDEILVYASR